MDVTPLDSWVRGLTNNDLYAYQLQQLNRTLRTVQKSIYYKGILPERIESMSEITNLPTMNAQTLMREGTRLVCTAQHEIQRIVTMQTSGTTGIPKRIYFTQEDQELTVDYFAHGLPIIAPPGSVTAIMLPCERPGGVGDLIAQALLRIPVTPIRCGPIRSLREHIQILLESGADSMIASPVQALNIARYCSAKNIELSIRKTLLSTDNIPRIIIAELQKHLGCEVFEHYGMTEMGLGGAIDCDAHEGQHIRENDLLFEILDENGVPVPDGEVGEIVFTTLTRRGMPFIRYRTGDISRIIPGTCQCGSPLKRIDRITKRVGENVVSECGMVIHMSDLDEILFAIPQVSDFAAKFSSEYDLLEIDIICQKSFGIPSYGQIRESLNSSELLGDLEVRFTIDRHNDFLKFTGTKRVLFISRS